MFSKREILLFVFSWVKTAKRSFATFLKYFWPILIAEIALKTFHGHPAGDIKQTIFFSILTLVSMLSIFFAMLSIRPSVETKNLAYFFDKFKKIKTFLPIFLTSFLIANYSTALLKFFPHAQDIFSLMLLFLFSIILLSISLVLMSIAPFFIFDGASFFESIKNTTKLVIKYFLPVFCLVLLNLSVPGLISFIPGPSFLRETITITSSFFFLCGFNILYVKIRHLNPKLFLK